MSAHVVAPQQTARLVVRFGVLPQWQIATWSSGVLYVDSAEWRTRGRPARWAYINVLRGHGVGDGLTCTARGGPRGLPLAWAALAAISAEAWSGLVTCLDVPEFGVRIWPDRAPPP